MRGFDWIDVRIHGLRGLPWYFWVSVLFGVALLVVAARSATSDHVDWAGFQVTLSVLVVALATLVATLPT